MLVIYCDIFEEFEEFLRILRTKSTLSQKLNITKIGKLFFHRFQNIANLLGQKKCGYFSDIVVNLLSIFRTKSTIFQKNKIEK